MLLTLIVHISSTPFKVDDIMYLGSLLHTYFTDNTTVAMVKLGGEIHTATLLTEAMVSVLKGRTRLSVQ